MSNNLIKYAFTAGELSPALHARTDLEQYDMGVALARNVFVDYKGGMISRAGLEFCEFVKRDDLNTRWFPFTYNQSISNTYVVLFGHRYIRFLQDGSYLLEKNEIAVENIGTGGRVTATGHGFEDGDWVKGFNIDDISNFNGRTFQVIDSDDDHFFLRSMPGVNGWLPDVDYTDGGIFRRIYTLDSPYGTDDLPKLKAKQIRDTFKLTHPGFPIRNLVRHGALNWDLSGEDIGVGANEPAGLSYETTHLESTPNAGAIFSVTAILKNGQETALAEPKVIKNADNISVKEGTSWTYSWNFHSSAVSYNVYRSIIAADSAQVSKGMEMGYIAHVFGTQMTDSNIVPDFTKKPPIGNDPFVPGAIESIFVTNGGSGYSITAANVTIEDPTGNGFSGYPIVNKDGQVTGVKIIDAGHDYSDPTVVFPGGGAKATAKARELDGTYPSCCAVFQQRMIYAASENEPMTIWGSKPRVFNNFDYSEITISSDSYEYEIDSPLVAPIRHMEAMRGGLLVMSQAGLWQLTGGNDGVVTATNAVADPQTYMGISELPPLKIGSDILYQEGSGYTIRLLTYNEVFKVYGAEDKTMLSDHFFPQGKRLTSWGFAENPSKLVWGVRSDGVALSFTIVKEEKVFAWTQHTTKGYFDDVLSFTEGDANSVYFLVRRYIQGEWVKYIERMVPRDFKDAEHSFCVDSGLKLGATTPAATLTVGSLKGADITLTTDVDAFGTNSVGRIVRASGGKVSVTEYISERKVKAIVLKAFTDFLPETDDEVVREALPNTWTLDDKEITVGGLWHLEGEEVSVLADGNVVEGLVVSNGRVTLPQRATRIVVGLKYKAVVKTLPPVAKDALIENKRKHVLAISSKVFQTRGLQIGSRMDDLYEAKERQITDYDDEIGLANGDSVISISSSYDNGSIYFVQEYPLPLSLLGYILDLEVGDDNS